MESNIKRKKAPVLIEPLAQIVAGPSQLRSFGQLRIPCGSTGRHLHVLHTHSLSNQPPSCPQFYFFQTSKLTQEDLTKIAYSGIVYSINSPNWLLVSFGCTLALGQLFHLNKLARFVHLRYLEWFIKFLECYHLHINLQYPNNRSTLTSLMVTWAPRTCFTVGELKVTGLQNVG